MDDKWITPYDHSNKQRWNLAPDTGPQIPIAYEDDRKITGKILGPKGEILAKYSDKSYVKIGFEIPETMHVKDDNV